jgi:hypothetical protein
MYVEVSEMSKNLASDSKKYKWGAKKLSIMVNTNNILLLLLMC